MRIGIIGYGTRVRGVFAELSKLDPSCRIVAIADPRKDEIKPLLTYDMRIRLKCSKVQMNFLST